MDALTELSNREAFFNDIADFVKKDVLFYYQHRLKNFKQVNGILGQRAGDALLYSVGTYLSQLESRATAYRTSAFSLRWW